MSVVTPKLLDNIIGATVTSLSGGLRGAKGYLDGMSDATNLKSAYTVTVEFTGQRSMRLKIVKSSAFSNVDNNTPVNAPLTGVITLQ